MPDLTLQSAATLYRLDRTTIRLWIRRGLPAKWKRLPGDNSPRWYVKRADVDAFIAAKCQRDHLGRWRMVRSNEPVVRKPATVDALGVKRYRGGKIARCGLPLDAVVDKSDPNWMERLKRLVNYRARVDSGVPIFGEGGAA